MDNLKAHENAVEELSEELLAAKILVYWIVPHASDQLQMLDVGIFSYQKENIHISDPTQSIKDRLDRLSNF